MHLRPVITDTTRHIKLLNGQLEQARATMEPP